MNQTNKTNGNGNGRSNGNGQNGQKKKLTKSRGGNGNGNGNGNGYRQQMQPVAARTYGAPVAYSAENRRQMNNRVVCLRGSDFLGTVTAKGVRTTAQDALLATFPVTPSGYPGTRVTQLSQLYERYRLRKFSFRFVPAVPTTVACQILFYVDLDPLDDPTTISDLNILIRQATAQTGSQQWNFHSPKSIQMAMRRDDQLYYTGEDKQNLRFSQQGTGYLIQVTDILDINGTASTDDIVCGSVYVDWEVDFQTPQINPEATVLALRTPAQLTGYMDLLGTAFAGDTIVAHGFSKGALYAITIGGAWAAGGLPSGSTFRAIGGKVAPASNGDWACNVSANSTGAFLNATGALITSTILPGVSFIRADEYGDLYITIEKTTTTELFASIRVAAVTGVGIVPASPIAYSPV